MTLVCCRPLWVKAGMEEVVRAACGDLTGVCRRGKDERLWETIGGAAAEVHAGVGGATVEWRRRRQWGIGMRKKYFRSD